MPRHDNILIYTVEPAVMCPVQSARGRHQKRQGIPGQVGESKDRCFFFILSPELSAKARCLTRTFYRFFCTGIAFWGKKYIVIYIYIYIENILIYRFFRFEITSWGAFFVHYSNFSTFFSKNFDYRKITRLEI